MKAPELSIDELKERFKKLKIQEGEIFHARLTLIIGLDGFLM